jgi:hypothetical protein
MLGGRPSDSDSYDYQTGKVDYQAIPEKEYFNRMYCGIGT